MKEADVPNYALESLKELGEIPSVPYLYEAAKREVEGRLRGLGFVSYNPEVHREKEGCFIVSDELATYVKIRRGDPKFSLVISSHLDHPGFAIKNSKEGIALGSVGIMRLRRYAQQEGVPLRVYGRSGELITTNVSIIRVSEKEAKPIITLESKDEISPNSHGIFDLPFISVEGRKIRMLAADNVACTAAILQCIKNVVENKNQFKDVDLTVIFPYIEEVKQISIAGIAKRGKTPFEDLNKDIIYIALEAMESEIDNNQRKILQELGLSGPNYKDGVLVKTTDSGLVFGQSYQSERNLAEELLLEACVVDNIRCQHTISSGTSEGTALSLFDISSNIATLVIPNRYKHNCGNQGEIVPEEIRINDLVDAIKILSNTIQLSGKEIPIEKKALSIRLKKTSLTASRKEMKVMKKEREALLTASLPRLRWAHFYPTSPGERAIIDFHRALAKIQSLIT